MYVQTFEIFVIFIAKWDKTEKKVLFWGADMCKFGTPSNEHHVKFNNLCFDSQYHASLHHHKAHFM